MNLDSIWAEVAQTCEISSDIGISSRIVSVLRCVQRVRRKVVPAVSLSTVMERPSSRWEHSRIMENYRADRPYRDQRLSLLSVMVSM